MSIIDFFDAGNRIDTVFKTTTNKTGVVIRSHTGILYDGEGIPIQVDATPAEKQEQLTALAIGESRALAHKMRDHSSAHLFA